MRIAMRVFSTDTDYNADCDYCVVDVTKELAQSILARRKVLLMAKGGDKDLYEIYYWGGTQEFYSYGDGDFDFQKQEFKDLERVFEDNSFSELPDNFELPKEAERTECDQMVISADGVQWVSIPKHCSIYVTSVEIPYSLIEACL